VEMESSSRQIADCVGVRTGDTLLYPWRMSTMLVELAAQTFSEAIVRKVPNRTSHNNSKTVSTSRDLAPLTRANQYPVRRCQAAGCANDSCAALGFTLRSGRRHFREQVHTYDVGEQVDTYEVGVPYVALTKVCCAMVGGCQSDADQVSCSCCVGTARHPYWAMAPMLQR
jgi:hypothetical protein